MRQPQADLNLPYATPGVRARPRPVWYAVVAVVLAWAASTAGDLRVSRLDASRWGTDPSIAESFARDGYRAGYRVPYSVATVVLDALATGLAGWACVGSRRKVFAAGTLVVCSASLLLHGFGLVVDAFFASG